MEEIKTKVCKKCHQEKTIDQFYFRNDNNTYRNSCNLCIQKQRTDNPIHNARCKEYQKLHRLENIKRTKIWRDTHPNKIELYRKQYCNENASKINEYDKLHRKQRRLNDPIFRLKTNMRNSLRKLLKNNKTLHTHEYICCTAEQLWNHLEKQFRTGMTRDNYGSVWHVDHIIPLAFFNELDSTEQKIANHWGNLQPLFVKENLVKNDKIPEKTNFRY